MNDDDTPSENMDDRLVVGPARQVLDQTLLTMSRSGVPHGLEADLVEYLVHLQEWLPLLITPMTHKSPALEFAFYDCCLRIYLAKVYELVGNSERVAVTSPFFAKKLLTDYLKGARAMERFSWKLSGTSHGAPFSASQKKRAAAAIDVEQTLLKDLLRSILPPAHYSAVDNLGINAQEWREHHGAGLTYGLKKYQNSIDLKRDVFSENFRTEHREKSAADIAFIQNLALLWRVGFEVEPTISYNRDHDTESPFCSFVGAAWKIATGENGPSVDKIRRALKKQKNTLKI